MLHLYQESLEDKNAMAPLLRHLLLQEAPTAEFKRCTDPALRPLLYQGLQLRARVPQYLVQHQAALLQACPLGPPGLIELVAGYAEPSSEELWATGLGLRRRGRRAAVDPEQPLRRSARLRNRRS